MGRIISFRQLPTRRTPSARPPPAESDSVGLVIRLACLATQLGGTDCKARAAAVETLASLARAEQLGPLEQSAARCRRGFASRPAVEQAAAAARLMRETQEAMLSVMRRH